MASSKMDKSSKVGGRRNKAPAAQKSSVAKGPRGQSVTHKQGAKGYHKR